MQKLLSMYIQLFVACGLGILIRRQVSEAFFFSVHRVLHLLKIIKIIINVLINGQKHTNPRCTQLGELMNALALPASSTLHPSDS